MTQPRTALECAQAQLDAYNSRNIDDFSHVYSHDVELYDLSTGVVFCKGRQELVERYGAMFSQKTSLHCTLVSRIVCSPFVYDQEHVIGLVDDAIVHAVATYEVRDGYIIKAWFAREQP